MDRDLFRDVFARVCTPVAAVTTTWEGRRHGTTVSAFCALSIEPPLILVALDRSSDVLRLIRASGTFGVNILGAEHESLARSLAGKGVDKGAAIVWDSEHHLPRLPDVPGWFECRVERLEDGGDHEIVIGLVVGAGSRDASPLLYRNRRFTTAHVGGGGG